MDNSSRPVLCHRLGGRGFLTDGVAAYPPFYLGVWDLMEDGKYEDAQAAWDRVIPSLQEFYARVTEKSGGEAKVEKALSEIMGFPVGPPRLPSIPLNAEEIAELRALMVKWGWPVPGHIQAA